VIVAGLALAGLRLGGRVAGSLAAEYNVAEVAVEGPISRDGGRPSPTTAGGTPADDIVDQIELSDGYPLTAETPELLDDAAYEAAADGVRRLVEAHPDVTVTLGHDDWPATALATVPDRVELWNLGAE
jgi:hypothetical protein